MKRQAWILVVVGLVAACRGSDAPAKSAPAAAGSAGSATAAAAQPPASPAAVDDLSGRWVCTWDLPDGSGDESWTLMQDGTAITISLRGSDPGGRYSGSMTGTLTGRDLELSYKFNDGTRGTMKLKASANGKVLDGESTRAAAGARPQHYACSRDDGSAPARSGGSHGGGGRSADITADCKAHTGVAYLEDCQQACWANGRLGEDKCREKCTAYCKPRP